LKKKIVEVYVILFSAFSEPLLPDPLSPYGGLFYSFIWFVFFYQ